MEIKKTISLFLAILFVSLLISACKNSSEKQKQPDLEITKQKKKIVPTKYGIAISDYTIVEEKIKNGQTIGDLFKSCNIDYQYVLKASDWDSIFDIRRIRSSHKITFFIKDTLEKTDYIVYEIDQKSFVVFDFTDTFKMYVKNKPLTIVHKKVAGEITSSLWNAMLKVNTNPILAINLSEIYAWSIDFFGLQKGDKFAVIYDEENIDTSFYQIKKIDAVCFIHASHKYYAYRFLQDSIWSFFDEKGNSLRKAFLKAPLRYSRISSHFTNRRFHPVLKIYRAHHGVDYAAATGTPVHSVGDGKVIKKAYQKRGGGRYVKIKHNSVYTTTYMHFSRFAKGIKVGDFVHQGQVIGYVGQSGIATGPHLDFRFYKNGKAVNPLKVESPPVEPIFEKNKEKFKVQILKYQSVLDSLLEK